MWFTWIIAGFSLLGVVLNIKKLRICFYIWAITNFSWGIIDLYKGIPAQAVLMFVYFGLALWGIYAWRNK